MENKNSISIKTFKTTALFTSILLLVFPRGIGSKVVRFSSDQDSGSLIALTNRLMKLAKTPDLGLKF